jgi:hypothetical protein
MKRKGVRKMRRSVLLMCSLLLSALLWGVPTHGHVLQSAEKFSVPAESTAYCHTRFPAMREDSLAWARPVFDDGTVYAVDFDGSCTHDPLGLHEIKPAGHVIRRGIYGEGE